MKIEEQNKQSRPSLYGSNATTSTFSVLGAVTPFGWSKQNVVLASVASFIVGGVMGGGMVGFVKQSETLPVASTISAPLPMTQAIQNVAVASTVVNPAVAKVTQPTVAQVEVIKPMNNPLASFKESADQERPNKDSTDQKIFEQRIVKPITKPRAISSSDDLAMRQLIENKSINKQTIRKDKVEKEKIEAAFKAELPIKTVHAPKDSNHSKVIVKPKKNVARDKDVLLVKSMLDTMDHPASKARSSPKKNEITPLSNK